MIWFVVIGLAVVQSWFGVGLLLVGTPTLLLLGIPYEEALWILLPCSLTVSTLQLALDGHVSQSVARRVLLSAVPMLVVGMVANKLYAMNLHMEMTVAAILAITAILRLSQQSSGLMQSFAGRHEGVILGMIGLVHGLTNMGGSLLVHHAAARHVKKLDIRQHVAVGYIIFAATQLLVLTLTAGSRLQPRTIGLTVIAGVTFVILGRYTFHVFSRRAYDIVLSSFMLVIAMMLAWRA